MRKLTKVLALIAALFVLTPVVASAQTTVNSTTLGAAVVTTTGRQFTLASVANISVGYKLFVDTEEVLVNSINSSTLIVGVTRGFDTTKSATHLSGSTVYISPIVGVTGQGPFWAADPPFGSCNTANEQFSLRINVQNGRIWSCASVGGLTGTWVNVIDGYAFVGPGSCFGSTTGGTLTTPAAVANVNVYATTWTGLINSSTTAPGTPVIQVSTTNAGTANNTVSCQIPIPTRTNASKGVYVVDMTWVYGHQQAGGNSTQVATEASGLLNGIVAFGKIVLPTPAASETASTVAQARWDTGTMVLLPVKTAFNAGVTSTGAFFTQKITPATPAPMNVDGTIYYGNFTVLETATTACTLQVAGVLVHYRFVNAGY